MILWFLVPLNPAVCMLRADPLLWDSSTWRLHYAALFVLLNSQILWKARWQPPGTKTSPSNHSRLALFESCSQLWAVTECKSEGWSGTTAGWPSEMAGGELSRALPGFQSVLGTGSFQQTLICSFGNSQQSASFHSWKRKKVTWSQTWRSWCETYI